MLISSTVTTLLLLIMFAVAIAILITATRTMDKIDMARGEAQQKQVGIRTINLNILAAVMQLVSFVFWAIGSGYLHQLQAQMVKD